MTTVRPWAIPDLVCLTGTEAADLDARAIEGRGVPESALMERAGTAAAALVRETALTTQVLVLAGKGNNGGDALVAARCLRAWGWQVRVLLTAARSDGDLPLLHGWPVEVGASTDLDDARLEAVLRDALQCHATVMDGILGTGIRGPARGEAARVIRCLAGLREEGVASGQVVSLDIPSGVEADTGAAAGPSVPADMTVSFGWPKLGTLLHPGRMRAGRQVTVEIGFPPLDREFRRRWLLTPAWAEQHRPRRSVVTHKNQVGALAVVAGRPGMAGAAVLTARAALRAGAGYVRIVTAPENREIVQSTLPEAVYVDAGDDGAVREALEASAAVALGPGLGTDRVARHLVDRVLGDDSPRVVDADALNILADVGAGSGALAGAPSVVTPHPGEARRLLGPEGPDPRDDRLAALRALSRRLGATVLLKGMPSLVLGADGLFIDTVGSSDLAVAGMGDTLTGAVGGFLAQGCSPEVAAGLGLVVTGRAAALADSGPGLQAMDVPESMPRAMRESAGTTDLQLPGVLLDLDPPR